jgi:RND family efflux transporter MFP subunit
VPVVDGDRVAAQQVLFQLNSKLEELEVERLRDLAESDAPRKRAEAALRHAELEMGRVNDLRDKDISSDRDRQIQAHEVELAKIRLQQAELEQRQAKNELAQARERLEQRTLRSPFAGIVTQRLKSEGEAVERFVPVVEVMSLDPLWIEFDCPFGSEHLFHAGGDVVVAPAVRPADTRTARILFVSMKATASSHTFMVRAAVANEDLRWKTGLKMIIRQPLAEQVPSKPGK